jgi:hypothetical protein
MSFDHEGTVTNDSELKRAEDGRRRPTPATDESEELPEDRQCSSDSYDVYTDHSSAANVQPPLDIQRNTESTVPIRYRKFPAKLDAMLSSPEFEPYVSWMPHGRSWRIQDPEGFATYVLPL